MRPAARTIMCVVANNAMGGMDMTTPGAQPGRVMPSMGTACACRELPAIEKAEKATSISHGYHVARPRVRNAHVAQVNASTDSSMENADFTNAYMIKQVNLNGCDLMGARFDGASLNCWLEGADLTGADFSKANFRTANNRLLVDEHTTLDGTLMTWRQAKHVDISGHRNEDPARWLMEHGVVMVGPKPGAHTGTGETHAQRNERIGRETGAPAEDVALAFEGARRAPGGWEVVPPYHTEPVARGRTREEAVKAALDEAPVMFSADTIRRAWRRHEGW